MHKTYVLDSFAVLCLLGREAGSEAVARLVRQAEEGSVRLLMTWVNAGEIAYIVERRWGKERMHQALGTLEATALEFVPVGRELALQAASIKASHSLAYADAFVAALAMIEGGVLVTGDAEFRQLEPKLQVQWLAQ